MIFFQVWTMRKFLDPWGVSAANLIEIGFAVLEEVMVDRQNKHMYKQTDRLKITCKKSWWMRISILFDYYT